MKKILSIIIGLILLFSSTNVFATILPANYQVPVILTTAEQIDTSQTYNQPELYITELIPSSTVARDGETVYFRATVKNSGTAVDDVKWNFYNNGYPTSDGASKRANGVIDHIDANGEARIEFSMPFYYRDDKVHNSGSFTTVLIIDSDKTIQEVSDINNYYGVTIYVKNPNTNEPIRPIDEIKPQEQVCNSLKIGEAKTFLLTSGVIGTYLNSINLDSRFVGITINGQYNEVREGQFESIGLNNILFNLAIGGENIIKLCAQSTDYIRPVEPYQCRQNYERCLSSIQETADSYKYIERCEIIYKECEKGPVPSYPQPIDYCIRAYEEEYRECIDNRERSPEECKEIYSKLYEECKRQYKLPPPIQVDPCKEKYKVCAEYYGEESEECRNILNYCRQPTQDTDYIQCIQDCKSSFGSCSAKREPLVPPIPPEPTRREPKTGFQIADVWSEQDRFGQTMVFIKVVDEDGTPATPEEGTKVTFQINLPNGKRIDFLSEGSYIAYASQYPDYADRPYYANIMNSDPGIAYIIAYAFKNGQEDKMDAKIEIFGKYKGNVDDVATCNQQYEICSKGCEERFGKKLYEVPIDKLEPVEPGRSYKGEPGYENGCRLNGRILPFGARIKGEYCDWDGTFKTQKQPSESAENSFECLSNFASNGQCVDVQQQIGILKRILSFFSRLFGGE